jgi:hypothetical protein
MPADVFEIRARFHEYNEYSSLKFTAFFFHFPIFFAFMYVSILRLKMVSRLLNMPVPWQSIRGKRSSSFFYLFFALVIKKFASHKLMQVNIIEICDA